MCSARAATALGGHPRERRVAPERVSVVQRGGSGQQLREIRGAAALDVRARRLARDAHLAAGGLQEAEKDGDEGGLARAVGAGDTDDLTRRDAQRDVVERGNGPAADERSVGLAECGDLDHWMMRNTPA